MIEPGLMDMIVDLRRQGIYSAPVLRVMEQISRRYFLDAEWHFRAYENMNLPIDCSESLLSPLQTAIMTQELDVQRTDRVLEIGTGSGYHSVVLSHLGAQVYTIERHHRLYRMAARQFQRLSIGNIFMRQGDGLQGWLEQAPFSRILITCALTEPPLAVLAQLQEDGRLVCVIDDVLQKFDRHAGTVHMKPVLPMSLPTSD